MTLTLGTNAGVCTAVKVIQVSHEDTLDTINAVRANNAAIRKLCPAQNISPAKQLVKADGSRHAFRVNVWQPLIFFEGEDEAAIKRSFVEVSARHKNNPNFGPYDVAKYVFRDLPEPELRALQAAEYWTKDIEVQQQIQDLVNYNGELDGKKKRLALLMKIAEDDATSSRDRIAAIRVAAELEGEITKAVEKKITYGGDGKHRQVNFVFGIDPKAGQPPEEIDEEVDE